MINNQFRCDGLLMQLEYYRGQPAGTAYVGVWRQVADRTLILKHRIPLLPAATGIHRLELTQPLPVARGDFLGVHYSRELPTGVIVGTVQADNLVNENELYYTNNYQIHDEDIVPGRQYNLEAYNGGMTRKTLALRAFVDYPGSQGNINRVVP